MKSIINIKISRELVFYPYALEIMEKYSNSGNSDYLWFLEHPPLYTAGSSAKTHDLLNPQFPVYAVSRGGQYTYHGPGQRIIYTMINLAAYKKDIKLFVWFLEEWIIESLKHLHILAFRSPGRVGIWVNKDGHDKKIAAIGIKVKKWRITHGISLNINPDLSHYDQIIPCGIKEYGTTSLDDMSIQTTLKEVDEILIREFNRLFPLYF